MILLRKSTILRQNICYKGELNIRCYYKLCLKISNYSTKRTISLFLDAIKKQSDMFKCFIFKNSNYFSDIFRKNKNISLFTSVVKMSSSSNNDKSPSPPKKDEADDKKDKKPSLDNESEPDIGTIELLI